MKGPIYATITKSDHVVMRCERDANDRNQRRIKAITHPKMPTTVLYLIHVGSSGYFLYNIRDHLNDAETHDIIRAKCNIEWDSTNKCFKYLD